MLLITDALPHLKTLVIGFSLRRPGLKPRCVSEGFVVDKMALGQVLSRFLLPKKCSFYVTYHSGLMQWATYGLRTKGLSINRPKMKKKKFVFLQAKSGMVPELDHDYIFPTLYLIIPSYTVSDAEINPLKKINEYLANLS